MKKNERPLLIVLVAIFAALAIFEPSYGWRVREWFFENAQGPAAGAAAASSDAVTLTAQNESLKAQLAALESVAAQMPQGPANGASSSIRAMVYSRYPFNFKNELLVDAGSESGVALGDPAVFDGVYLGSVSKVFSNTALVQTVFDDNFKMAVRIGGSGYDALLVGGAAPVASSIVKTAAVVPGDIVYTAAPGAPYGLPVAVVAATSSSPDGLFENASLGFAYDINTIQSVVIER